MREGRVSSWAICSADNLVPIAQEDMLYHGWCTQGASVQYEVIPGLEHLSAYVLGSWRGIQWLADRVEGAPTVTGCQEVGLP
jgi:hypothetical protein